MPREGAIHAHTVWCPLGWAGPPQCKAGTAVKGACHALLRLKESGSLSAHFGRQPPSRSYEVKRSRVVRRGISHDKRGTLVDEKTLPSPFRERRARFAAPP